MKITATGLTPSLREQVELLVATPVGTVVLDRDFGLDQSFLDEPLPVAQNHAAAEIAVKLERYIPQVEMDRVRAAYPQAAQGVMELEVVVRAKR